MSENQKRGRGRPPLTDEERVQKTRFTSVIPTDLTKRLQESADQNKRNRNAEVVARLEESFSQPLFRADFGDTEVFALCRVIGRMIHRYKVFEGDFLFEDAGAHAEMKDAIGALLDAFGPDGGIPEPTPDETAGQRRARSNLTAMLRIKQHGRGDDESADAVAIEETLDELGKLADKLVPKG
jgi:hypothetical protein